MNRKTDYELLTGQLQALTQGIPYEVANLANAAALLWENLSDINWAGFYKMVDGALVCSNVRFHFLSSFILKARFIRRIVGHAERDGQNGQKLGGDIRPGGNLDAEPIDADEIHQRKHGRP